MVNGSPAISWLRSLTRLPENSSPTSPRRLEADVDEAITSTHDAAATMGQLPAHARYNVLQQVAALLYRRRDEFVAADFHGEAGKPITDAKREVSRAIQTFTVAAEEARRIPGEVIPFDWTPGFDTHLGVLRRFPIGPFSALLPSTSR